MTAPKSRARTPRRSISIAADPLDNPTPAAPPTPVEPAAATPTGGGRAKPHVRSRTAAPKDEPPMIDPGLRAGEESWDEESFKLTANIPKSLHRRASGLVTYAQMHGLGADGKEDIFSLTDLVRISLHEKVREYEQRLNEGNPFPAPRSLPKGRR